ncbi:hypothetical protein BGX21_005689, partial [Mortierella sp. AD011]
SPQAWLLQAVPPSTVPPKRDRQIPTTPQQDEASNPFCVSTQEGQAVDYRQTINSELKRDGSCISYNEHCLLAQIFGNIMKTPKEVQEWFSPPGCRAPSIDLAKLTGIGEKTCRIAIKFERTGIIDVKETIRTGRPKKAVDQDRIALIMQMVMDSNKRGEPNSARGISNRLRKEYGIARSARTVTRDLHELGLYWRKGVQQHDLHELGLYWGKGVQQHILHDSEENVAYRHQYLRRRFKNLMRTDGGKFVPQCAKKIAEKTGGHQVCKTPPYHCELQPIEEIWAVVKNMVAANATGEMKPLELKRLLDHYFACIPEEIFRSVWNTSIDIGQTYLDTPASQVQGSVTARKPQGDASDANGDTEDQEDVLDQEEAISRISDEGWKKALGTTDYGEQDTAFLLEPVVVEEQSIDDSEEEEEEEPLIRRNKRRRE